MVWIIGEYAERIDNADELLEMFLDTFPEETAMVRGRGSEGEGVEETRGKGCCWVTDASECFNTRSTKSSVKMRGCCLNRSSHSPALPLTTSSHSQPFLTPSPSSSCCLNRSSCSS